MKIHFLLLTFTVLSLFSIGQQRSPLSQEKMDSLNNLIETSIGNEKINILLTISEELSFKEPKKAIKYSNDALEVAKLLNDKASISESYYILGINYFDISKYDSAIHFLRRSLELRIKLNDKLTISKSHYWLGRCYSESNDYNKAIEYFSNARLFLKEIGDTRNEIHMLVNIGIVKKQQSEYVNAIEFYQQALLLSEKINDSLLIAQSLNNIADIYKQLKKYDKSLEYNEKALVIRQLVNNNHGIAASYNNIANCYSKIDKPDKALEYYFMALEINIETKHIRYQAYNYNNISSIYKKMGKYDSALYYLDLSIKIKEKRSDRYGLVNSYNNMASLNLLKDDFERAIEFSEKALFLAKEIGSKTGIRSSYSILSDIYAKISDYKKALEYNILYSAYKDSIINEKNIEIITDIQTKYETEKIEQENENLKKEAENRKNIQIALLTSGILLFVVVILLFILFRIKSRSLSKSKQLHEKEISFRDLEDKHKDTEKQRFEELIFAEKEVNRLQNEKLSILNRQMSLSAMQVLNKTELLNEIQNEIESDDFEAVKKTSSYQKLKKQIIDNKNIDQDWDQFKKHFEKVHEGFFEKLRQQYPKLTNNDLKLCAYIRIGLSTKETARIFNITTAAITKSRHRLKKKLQLDATKDLFAFIGQV